MSCLSNIAVHSLAVFYHRVHHFYEHLQLVSAHVESELGLPLNGFMGNIQYLLGVQRVGHPELLRILYCMCHVVCLLYQPLVQLFLQLFSYLIWK